MRRSLTLTLAPQGRGEGTKLRREQQTRRTFDSIPIDVAFGEALADVGGAGDVAFG